MRQPNKFASQLLVWCLLFQAMIGFAAGEETEGQPSPKLRYFVEKFAELENKASRINRDRITYGEALATLIQDVNIIPKNGIVHVVGPYTNAAEWFVYILLRKDIKVIVSEVSYDANDPGGFDKSFEKDLIQRWWASFINHSELVPLMQKAQVSLAEVTDLVINATLKITD